jgi:hypothetical protein
LAIRATLFLIEYVFVVAWALLRAFAADDGDTDSRKPLCARATFPSVPKTRRALLDKMSRSHAPTSG